MNIVQTNFAINCIAAQEPGDYQVGFCQKYVSQEAMSIDQ